MGLREESDMGDGTKIINCTCKHQYQDEKYGPGRRVGNLMKDGKGRCTVCNKIQGDPTPVQPK